jgi:hypothetical protein
MPKTALLWLLLYCGSLIATWVDPMYGLLGVFTEYYRRPGLQWWGNELPRLRWNLIVTAIFAASVLLKYNELRPLPKVHKLTIIFFVAFAVNLWLVNLVNPIDRARGFEFAIYWSKVALMMPLLIILVLRSRRSIDLFILANIVGVAVWGWDAYTDPRREAARLVGIGSGDTYNDNFAANHLLLILPLIVITILNARTTLHRIVAVVALPLVVNTLILCNSRGSMVGLAIALATVPLLARKGHRAKSLAIGVAVVGCLLFLADDQFISRQKTTTSYQEDGSAQGRLEAWRQAARILADYPLGVGARGFHVLIPKYSTTLAERHNNEERAPHNTIIQVTTEYGVQGLALWLLMCLSVFRLTREARLSALQLQDNYFYYRLVAVSVALVGWIAGSVFVDRLYSEGIYWIVALAIAMHRLVRAEIADVPIESGVPACAA